MGSSNAPSVFNCRPERPFAKIVPVVSPSAPPRRSAQTGASGQGQRPVIVGLCPRPRPRPPGAVDERARKASWNEVRTARQDEFVGAGLRPRPKKSERLGIVPRTLRRSVSAGERAPSHAVVPTRAEEAPLFCQHCLRRRVYIGRKILRDSRRRVRGSNALPPGRPPAQSFLFELSLFASVRAAPPSRGGRTLTPTPVPRRTLRRKRRVGEAPPSIRPKARTTLAWASPSTAPKNHFLSRSRTSSGP